MNSPFSPRTTRPALSRSRQSGFVLVNALIIVAALSAAAIFILHRSENARWRLTLTQSATQAGLYLDAFEVLAISLLDADTAADTLLEGATDHPKEGWKLENHIVEVDRGQVRGTVFDLQGRFNINRLSNPDDTTARAVFERLVISLGVSPQIGEAIVGFVQQDVSPEGYASQSPPIRPAGGAISILQELRHVRGMDDESFDRLAPFITAISAGAGLNINTVNAKVLMSFLPDSNALASQAVLSARSVQPFQTLDEFVTVLEDSIGVEMAAEIDIGQFTVKSRWFGADIHASLDQMEVSRQVVFHRVGRDRQAQVEYRVNDWW